VAIAKVDAGLVELRQAGGDAFLCVTVHDELVVDSAVEDADQAAAILESGMREGFREVFGELPDYEAIARYVVGGVECAPSWGGETFDPETMTEQDRKNLFKGLGESIDEIKPDDEDDDENAIEIAIIQEFETVEAKGEDGP
jgi:hypothetical protein